MAQAKQKDTTMDSKVPKRMGRPPKPEGAMSNKERQQKWRDKVKADAYKLLQQLKDTL